MPFKNYLWIIPFISFIAGYVLFEKIFHKKTINTPSIVGINLLNALSLLSDNQINLKILAKKEDPDLPQGTILSQTPKSGKKIKPQQPLFVVISQKPPKILAPRLINKTQDKILQIIKPLEIHNKSYFLSSSIHPHNLCMAQTPLPKTLMDKKYMITYIAKRCCKPVILPDFTHKKISAVQEFLQHYNAQIKIIYSDINKKTENSYDKSYVITDQRPLAGTLVTLSDEKKLPIYLQISKIK